MSYYLKKTKLKGRTYLSIDESFYSHEKKGTAHKCFKSLGSVETHMENGMEVSVKYSRTNLPPVSAKATTGDIFYLIVLPADQPLKFCIG